jgi:hypothetical protein
MIIPMALIREGDLDIHGDQTVTQRVTGTLTVHPGSSLVLMGTAEGGVIVLGGGLAWIAGITHGLFIAAGGRAVLRGSCIGPATNDGGELSIEADGGIVTGDAIRKVAS